MGMSEIPDFQKLFDKLSYRFNNISFIQQAFTHRSYLNETKENIGSNERMEFLGDSILSFLVSDYLYKKYPDYPEGELTNLRSSMVKTATLAEVARELDLGKYLMLSHGEEESGGRNNTSILADTFEAFLGAVYQDSGLAQVKEILSGFLFPKLDLILNQKAYKDAKSIFQEMVQEELKISPSYKVISEKGPDHAKEFEIGVFVNNELYGRGFGKSKQEGEMQAAQNALNKWSKTGSGKLS